MTLPEAHIVLSAYNAEAYLAEQIESIRAQTHEDWTLSIRDDGSTDATGAVARNFARKDARITVVEGENLGAARSFGRLLGQLPEGTRYVFCSDADDVWLPEKVRYSLEGMLSEEDGAEPLLVHTDLVVTDRNLDVIHPSFWSFADIDPTRTDLGRLLVANVATGPTFLFNRPLLERVVGNWAESIPDRAAYQDWWISLVAGAFGRLVALPEATVLYRRHDSNATGDFGEAGGQGPVLKRFRSRRRTREIRAAVDAVVRQATAFLERYGEELPEKQQETLRMLSGMMDAGPIVRKLRILRYFAIPEWGLARNVGLVLRG